MMQATERLLLQGSGAKGIASLLRRSAASLLFSSSYATERTRPPHAQDYSIVMREAERIANAAASEPVEKEVGMVSSVPLETCQRQVRIWVPSKSSSQAGHAKTVHSSVLAPVWSIDFGSIDKWENPLIGWTSTADPLECVGRASLLFYTKEQAIAFCKKHGWEYTVDEPNYERKDRQKRFSTYGDNFSTKRRGVPDLSHLPSNKTK